MNCHIVGCGLLGSKISFNILKLGIVENLYVYDYDIVEHTYFPFCEISIGLPKVEVIDCLATMIGSSTNVIPIQTQVTNKRKFNDGIVIDCRDNKKFPIFSNIRLSLDGSIFYYDSLTYKKFGESYHEYIYDHNQFSANLASELAVKLIFHDKIMNKELIFNLEGIVPEVVSL